MEIALDQYYCQTLELKQDNQAFQCEFCLAVIPLTELQKTVKAYLHPDELAHFSTLTFARRQLSYLLGHFVAKQAIVRYTKNIAPTNILIEYGIFQYPLIFYPGKDNIQVSYSHSNNGAVALVYPETHPMGIDLEEIDADKNEVIKTQLTQTEEALIHSLADPEPARLLTLFWTIKEALSKVLRTGMMSPFDIYAIKSVKTNPNGWRSEFKNFAQYQVLSFPLGHFICSIVYPKQVQMTINISAIQDWLRAQSKL